QPVGAISTTASHRQMGTSTRTPGINQYHRERRNDMGIPPLQLPRLATIEPGVLAGTRDPASSGAAIANLTATPPARQEQSRPRLPIVAPIASHTPKTHRRAPDFPDPQEFPN